MSRDVGPELGALLATRRWLVAGGIGAAWGITTVFGIAAWPQTSSAEQGLHLLSGALIVSGLLLGRHAPFLWLPVVGLGLLVIVAVTAPDDSPAWIPLGTMCGYATYIAVTLCSPRVGLVIAISGAGLLALAWSTEPAAAIPGGLAFLGGWVQVAQQLAGSLAMWWAWNTLLREARAADAALLLLQERTAEALAVQERARLWRATAIRLHESVLNSIRYVLLGDDIDRQRLGDVLARQQDDAQIDDAPYGGSLPGLLDELLEDEVAGTLVRVNGPVPDLRLDGDVFRAARAAVVEAARNSVRHGGPTTVVISVDQLTAGTVALQVVDDGGGPSSSSRPGIGSALVLDSALRDVGGSWRLVANESGGSTVTIRFPCIVEGETAEPAAGRFPPFDKGRLLVTAPVAGTAAVGWLYYWGLLGWGGTAAVVAVVAGLVACISAPVIVLRRRRLRSRSALLLVLVPACVPWLLAGQTLGCLDAAAASRATNIAGFGVLIIVAWGGRLAGLVGFPVWGVGSILLASAAAPDCRGFSLVAILNTLIALPLVLIVTYIGARAYQRAQDRAYRARRREIRERSRALAAVDLNTALRGSVQEALSLLGELAAGARLDDAMKQALQRVDGQMRAAIQVDAQSDGSMAVLAKTLVDEVAALGGTVDVRSLVSSRDHRPVPEWVQRALVGMLSAASDRPPVLQVFTDGREDHLSVVVSTPALRAAGLDPGASLALDDVSVDVDDASAQEDADIAVLISRRIEMARPRSPSP